MIISNSAVDMTATATRKTSYEQKSEVLMTNPFSGEMRYRSRSFSIESEQEVTDSRSDNSSLAGQNCTKSYMPMTALQPANRANEASSVNTLLSKLREYLYNFRKSILENLGIVYGASGTSALGSGADSYAYGSGADAFAGGASDGRVVDFSTRGKKSVWVRKTYNSVSYSESESMDFQTAGSVVTADGRTINFGMTVSMSREFTEQSESLTMDTVAIMTDPLVISLDTNPVSVSDQKWQFDIDGDGNKDSISLLSKGCGFLAYDRDEDGAIDDGTELFGAKTGDGFSELSDYDEDGNGWIDENDSIYDKLSVWVKDDSGTDEMLSLKDANVGAIYLGSVSSEYALKSDEDNSYNAQIKRTGMYMSEDGVAKTMSQLDMVKALIS